MENRVVAEMVSGRLVETPWVIKINVVKVGVNLALLMRVEKDSCLIVRGWKWFGNYSLEFSFAKLLGVV